MDAVFATLNRWQGQRFEWGVFDCCTAVADWVLDRTGRDPMHDLRLTYGSAGECQRVTRFFTDPLGAVVPRMSACGLTQTATPLRGDVGLVLVGLTGSVQPHLALCIDARLWGIKVEGGAMAVQPIKVLVAWTVPQ